VSPDRNPVGYTFDNEYYGSPDAEVLYAMVRTAVPPRVVEVGCGQSTRVTRLAIRDASLPTRVIAVDPEPRCDIVPFIDEFCHAPVESAEGREAVRRLRPGDMLFIDSSHHVRTGNDVVTLYLDLLPRLPGGVIIHIHDIFLPFDYPKHWIVDQRYDWNEQYLVQALLAYGAAFDVLWAGRYVQNTHPVFPSYFPHCRERPAQSLWLRKR
jgi:hypothetical protein